MVNVQRVSFSFLYSDILSSGIYLFHMAEKKNILAVGEKGKRIYDLSNTRSGLSFLIALQETDVYYHMVTSCQECERNSGKQIDTSSKCANESCDKPHVNC